MSVSTQAAPRQMSFGRFPAALAMLALVVVIAAAVALVALSGSKTAIPAAPAAGAPPVVIDHGWSNGQTVILPKTISHYGGWSGPVLTDPNYVAPSVLEQTKDNTFGGRSIGTGGGHNGALRAQ